jgi:hypothetical protein
LTRKNRFAIILAAVFTFTFVPRNFTVHAVDLENNPKIFRFSPKKISASYATPHITIYGANFPWASTDSYVQNGLVAHYDAINNTGKGDTFHSRNATEWADLKNGVPMTIVGNCTWDVNDLHIVLNSSCVTSCAYRNGLSLDQFTVEETFNGITTADTYFPWWNNSTMVGKGTALGAWSEGYWWWDGVGADSGAFKKYIPVGSLNGICQVALSMSSSAMTSFNDGKMVGNTTAMYANKTPTYWCTNIAQIGGYTNRYFDAKIYAYRVYNRALSEAELAANYAVDQKRFIAPPVIKLHSKQKNYYSTSVAVVAPDRLEATFPQLHTGKYSVYFRWDGKEYRYPRLCHVTVTNDFNVSGPPGMPGDLKVKIGKKKQ